MACHGQGPSCRPLYLIKNQSYGFKNSVPFKTGIELHSSLSTWSAKGPSSQVTGMHLVSCVSPEFGYDFMVLFNTWFHVWIHRKRNVIHEFMIIILYMNSWYEFKVTWASSSQVSTCPHSLILLSFYLGCMIYYMRRWGPRFENWLGQGPASSVHITNRLIRQQLWHSLMLSNSGLSTSTIFYTGN